MKSSIFRHIGVIAFSCTSLTCGETGEHSNEIWDSHQMSPSDDNGASSETDQASGETDQASGMDQTDDMWEFLDSIGSEQGENQDRPQQSREATYEPLGGEPMPYPEGPECSRWPCICTCEDFDFLGNGACFESLEAIMDPESSLHRANIGVNRDTASLGNVYVDGVFDVAGTWDRLGNLMTRDDWLVGKNVEDIGNVWIDDDAFLGDNLKGTGNMWVEGTLSIAGQIDWEGNTQFGALIENAPFHTHIPCPCEPGQILDVPAVVAAHRGDPPPPLPSGLGNDTVTIAAGDYYSDGDAFLGNSLIKIDGKVRLFIEGDVEFLGNRMFDLSNGAELDIYISGSLRRLGNVASVPTDGDISRRAVHLYVGGSDTVSMAFLGNEAFWGSIYAPTADYNFLGNVMVYGCLFVKNLHGLGNIIVICDGEAVGDDCDDDPPVEE